MSMATSVVKGWVLGVLICLAACGTTPEPFEYQDTNERKPGRGVFTGEDGTWTIYRKPMPAETEAAPSEEAGAEAEKGGTVDKSPTDEKTARD